MAIDPDTYEAIFDRKKKMTGHGKDYRSIAAEKQRQRQDKIPKEWLIDTQTHAGDTNLLQVPATCGVLDEIERRITSDYDATALLEKIKGGIWTAEQVTVAFCKRAAIAQQLVSLASIVAQLVPD